MIPVARPVMLPALFLLASSVVLRDDTNTVPSERWRYERFVTKDQLPVNIDCVFKVVKGPPVRVELMTDENLEALRNGQPHEFMSTSANGRLRQEIVFPGTFDIVVFNDDKSLAADVSMRISLDFSTKPLVVKGQLSPERKLIVVILSFGGFLTVVALSARKLIFAMRDSRITSSRTPDAAGSTEPTPDRDPD
jgi:hypothetical protein